MSRIFLLVASFLFYNSLYSQKQIHIKYLNVRSVIANVYEELYTNGIDVISIQDGKIISTSPNNTNLKKRGHDVYFISKLNNENSSRKIQFTGFIGYQSDKEFFVNDSVPAFKWVIDESSKKKVLGYNCIKATTVFRGSKITAYFTRSIPYSIGPFKFFGLPGAILDVRENNKSYDIWKAIEVNLDDKTKVNYHPKFPDYKNVDIRTYIELKDADRKYFFNATTKNLPAGVKVDAIPERLGIEKIFEWEK